MHSPKLMTSNRIQESLSNLCCGGATVADLCAAIDKSTTAEELVRNINALDLGRTFTISREGETYVRLKSVDYIGNASYLTVQK